MKKQKTLSDTDYNALQTLLTRRVNLVNSYQRYKEDHRTGVKNDTLAEKIRIEREYKEIKANITKQIDDLTQ